MAKKILVVDDEPNIVKMVGNRLRANNYEVITAIDGVDGIEKAKEEKPDLILLDIMMDRLDGHQTLDKLKELEETRSIPVIMLTAKAQSEDVERAMAGGSVDYIVKPFTPVTLLQKIERAVPHTDNR